MTDASSRFDTRDRLSVAAATDQGDRRPTRLLEHDLASGSVNCLALAVARGRAPSDELVFLSSPADAARPGHVVLRDVASGAVREPDGSGIAAVTIEDYAAASGLRVRAMAPVARVRAILSLPAAARGAALRGAGRPLAGIAELPFGMPGGAPIILPPPPPPPPTEMPDAENGAVKGWLDALGEAVSEDERKGLAQTANDATTVLDWFEAHRRGDPRITDDMPQNVSEARERLLSTPAVAERITVDEDGGRTVTRDALKDFKKDLESSADKAKESWNAYKEKASADPVGQQKAVDASILQANLPVLDAANAASAVDGTFDAPDLRAIASPEGRGALPQALTDAAGSFVESGDFDDLTRASNTPNAAPNATPGADNLDAFLEQNIPQDADEALNALNRSALEKAVREAGGDPNTLKPENFVQEDGGDQPRGTFLGSEDASPADKAATLLQLGQGLGRMRAGGEAIHPGNDGLDAERSMAAMVQTGIDTLSADPEVQAFLREKKPEALRGIVDASPGIEEAVEKNFDASATGQALNDALGAKGADGEPLSTTDALNSFVQRAGGYAEALGAGPEDLKARLETAFSDASDETKGAVERGYEGLTSGGRVSELMEGGASAEEALTRATAEKSAYDSVLDRETVDAGSEAFTENATRIAREDLTDGASAEDLLEGIGVDGLDDPSLTELVEENYDTLAPPGPNRPQVADIVMGVRGIVDGMRGGNKFDEAVAKLRNGPHALPDAAKTGALHGASALLLGGAMGARLAAQGNPNPTQTAAQSLQIAGLLTEGGAKYVHDQLEKNLSAAQNHLRNVDADPNVGVDTYREAQLAVDDARRALNGAANPKVIENAGKALGVAGNAAGVAAGALGLKAAIASGDQAGIAINATTAALNGIAAISGAGEVAAFVAPRLATNAVTAAIGASASAFSAVSGAANILGGIATMGIAIWTMVEIGKEKDRLANSIDGYGENLQADFSPLASEPSLQALGQEVEDAYEPTPFDSGNEDGGFYAGVND